MSTSEILFALFLPRHQPTVMPFLFWHNYNESSTLLHAGDFPSVEVEESPEEMRMFIKFSILILHEIFVCFLSLL